MKHLSKYILESLLDKEDNIVNRKIDFRMYDKWFIKDGFQFGWSAHISDKDWFPIFDMNYLRNYYQKYCDIDKVLVGIDNNNWVHFCMWEKYPKHASGQGFFTASRAALAFAILSTEMGDDFDEDAVINHLSKFLNKENGSDKETKITIEHMPSAAIPVPFVRVKIENPKLFNANDGRRPLTLDFVKKSVWRQYIEKI